MSAGDPSGLPVVRVTPRWPVLRRGAVALAAGLALLAVGAALYAGRDAVALAAPAARGTIPGDARFKARDARYVILLNRLRLTGLSAEIQVASTTCTVRRDDGSSVRVRGARQSGSSDSDLALSIGAFDGRPGPTAVACRYGAVQRGPARFVVAARTSSVTAVMWTLLGAGLLIGGAGAALVTWALRHPIVRREPPST